MGKLAEETPAVATTAHGRDNMEGPVSGLLETLAISVMLIFSINH